MFVFEGPGILWAFVKAMGITDEVGSRLEELYVDRDRNPSDVPAGARSDLAVEAGRKVTEEL